MAMELKGKIINDCFFRKIDDQETWLIIETIDGKTYSIEYILLTDEISGIEFPSGHLQIDSE